MPTREIKTTLALDGEQKFKQEMQAAAREIRVLGSEIKLNTIAFAENEDSLEALTSRGQIYEKQVAQQKEIVNALTKAVADSAEKYGEADKRTDDYRIQLNNATIALSKMEKELDQNNQAINEYSSDAAKAAKRLEEIKKASNEFGESLKSVGSKISGIGQSMSIGITAPLTAGFALATKGTEELRGDVARLDTNAKMAGISTDSMRESLVKLSGVSEETDSNIEALSNLLRTGLDEKGITSTLDALSGAVISFPDTLKIEGLADGLQETLATGKSVGPFSELLERMGMNLEEFDKGLQKANESGTQQQYILDTLAKTGLAQVNEEYRKSNEELIKSREASQEFQLQMAELGTMLTPILTGITEKITEVVKWFNNLDEDTKKIILTIAGLVAGIGPLLVIVGSAISMFGSLTMIAGGLGISIGALVGPIAIAVAAIVGIITAGIALYKNWDEIKAYAAQLVQTIKEKFEYIKRVISETWEKAKNATKNAVLNIASSIKETLSGLVTSVFSIGSDIVSGLWNGIKSMDDWIENKISGFVSGITNSVKDFLGIRSPSKVFAGIGGYMAEGLGQGFNKEMQNIAKEINNSIPASIDITGQRSVRYNGISSSNQTVQLISNIFLDGKQIAQVSSKHLYDLHQRQGRGRGVLA